MKKSLFVVFIVLGVVFLLAGCEAADTSFSVIYHANANGTDGFVTDNTKYQSGDVATVLGNNFTYSGHTFVGWNTTPQGNGDVHQKDDKITMYHTVHLYAQWKTP